MRSASVAILPLLLVLAGCENDFYLKNLPAQSPAQVSVVSTSGSITGSIIVHWSAVDGALEYDVYLSEEGDDAGDWHDECEVSPCRVDDLDSGRLYYVRVVSISEGFAPDPEDDGDAVADLVDVSVRAGFPGQPRGPFVWAGTAILYDDRYVSFLGMWFEDDEAPATEHACYTYWEDGTERTLDPCTNADLADPESDASQALWNECLIDVCHPVFEVQAEDGRFGQAFTRVVVP